MRPGLRRVERSISGRIALNQDVARCPLMPSERERLGRCARRGTNEFAFCFAASAEALAGGSFHNIAVRRDVSVRTGLYIGIGYDPSAGSPTETLLRLLLPLKDQVRTSFSLAVSRTDVPELPPTSQSPASPSEVLTKSFNR